MNSDSSYAADDYPKTDQRKRVFCILSDDRVFRTKSPAMFNAAIKQAGINGTYIPLKVEPDFLGNAIQSLKVLNFAGANITVPYKEKVVGCMDKLSREAGHIGAVNTVTLEKDVIMGHNTNAVGFEKSVEEVGYPLKNKSVMVFGSGGAARAIVYTLNRLKANPIFVTGRNQEKIRQLVSDLGGQSVGFDELTSGKINANLVINATSVASHEESTEMASMVENINLENCQWIIDLNYGRQNYIFRDLSQKIGTRFMDGIPMLAHQASKSFALWTSIDIAPAIFMTGL